MKLPPNDDLTPDPQHYWLNRVEMEGEIIEAVKLAMTDSEIEELYDIMDREGWL